MTEVSAGALAAGAGASAGFGAAPGGQGAKSGAFAKELGGALNEPGGPAADAAPEAYAGEVAGDAGGDLAGAAGVEVPYLPAEPQAGTPGAAPAVSPAEIGAGAETAKGAGGGAGLMPEAGGPAGGAPGLAAAGAGAGQTPADGTLPGLPKGAAATPGSGKQGVPAGEAGPVAQETVSTAGADPLAQVLNGGGPAEDGAADAVAQASIAQSGTANAALQGVDASAAQADVGDVPQTNRRRWRNELPQEFRAQAVLPAASSQTAAAQATAVDAGAGVAVTAGAAVSAESSLSEGSLLDADAVEHGVEAVKSGPRPANETPGLALTQAQETVDGTGAADQDGIARTSSTVSPTPSSSVSSSGAQVPGPAAAQAASPVQQSLAAAELSADVAGEPAAEDGLVSDVSQSVSETGEEISTVKAGSDDKRPGILSVEKAMRQAEKTLNGPAAGTDRAASSGQMSPVEASVAAAFLASQLAQDDGDSASVTADLSLSADAMGTVRGGGAQGAMRTESLQTPTQAQSGQVATQVAAEIARNLKDGNTRFQMRFDPPELGRVEVNMKVASDGSVQAHLIVDRPETLDMFLRDQRGLERALEAAGLNANSENLQFSLKQDGSGGFASGEEQGGQASGSEGGAATAEETAEPLAEEIVRLTLAQQRGGLDLRI
ncbi:flagellar hook-length control protein FliK [Roseibium aggregatum]|uniref:Flagellar hook-length control protein FliK n=1 Tax=Roseibium aggregatum TaxID=187304 RepID=A0A939J2Z1_9HYPH|nr:flagellar hook-length control protein FliK [Roseibium aggregatum]MBN9673691.1 flagellar hook-length control protein FliK [Roseibium aggregatum]